MERMNEENVEEDRHFALLSKSISASRERKGISEHLQGLIATQGGLRHDYKTLISASTRVQIQNFYT